MDRIVITVVKNGYEVREYNYNERVDIADISVFENQNNLFHWLKNNMNKPVSIKGKGNVD